MLKANRKAGVRDTLIVGMKQSVALYHTKETANQRPFRVAMKNVNDSLDLLVQYGGMDAGHARQAGGLRDARLPAATDLPGARCKRTSCRHPH